MLRITFKILIFIFLTASILMLTSLAFNVTAPHHWRWITHQAEIWRLFTTGVLLGFLSVVALIVEDSL